MVRLGIIEKLLDFYVGTNNFTECMSFIKALGLKIT